MYVLRLNQSSMPLGWISIEEACKHYCLGNVLFELGDFKRTLNGGFNNQGLQSHVEIASIIGCKGRVVHKNSTVPLLNRWLFVRDEHTCLYCGKKFPNSQLTFDHIIPRSRGGKRTWTNAATSCKRCNVLKGARTPEEAGMELLAVPFKPNPYEQLFLRNNKILRDQVNYLSGQFSAKRDWLANSIIQDDPKVA
ncbi:MAG: HNH endonuclease [Aestuariibacter sp.]